ncbi:hypothetical protein GCM10011352_18180 [Marinobacterium zhoushanense]|uniref:Cation transporter n=1 Tax=Marinobacterium zhoushanense TaxID=1679163 RepID=A0ABQ1KDR9_9GAMM|nr:cation transporter [Marinobacterium zhoushanense]GGB92488.1 hypothetical protein GCM10011352_18180 [Marinobacterium zhoushanense]
MSDLDHRPGVKEANLVTRKLKLSGIDQPGISALVAELDQLFGMDSVNYASDSATLSFAYDATHCSVDVVESIVNKHGAQFAASWWNRTKRGYYRFVDQNMKDNAGYEPHCCNKVPRK